MVAMIAVLFLMQASAPAGDTQASAPPQATTQQQPAATPDPRQTVVCHQEVMLGSAIPKRVCETPRQTSERAETLGEHLRHAVHSAGTGSFGPNGFQASSGGGH